MVGPLGVTGYGHHDFVAGHLLYECTGLCSLAWVGIAAACVLVGSVHSSRHLSVAAAYLVVVVVGGGEVVFVAGVDVIGGGLTESLCNVDAVPVGQVAFHFPVATVLMEFLDDGQQFGIAGMVVEPDGCPLIVGGAFVLPVVFEELLVGNGKFPFEVLGHGREYAFVAAVLVIGLQGP